MLKRDKITELYPGNEFLFMDGIEYDQAIVGVAEQFGHEMKVCYDKNKILNFLISDGMSHDEALEFFDYNIIGTGGKNVPVFIEKV